MPNFYRRTFPDRTELGVKINSRFHVFGKILPATPDKIFLSGFDAFETLVRAQVVSRNLNVAGGFVTDLLDDIHNFPEVD